MKVEKSVKNLNGRLAVICGGGQMPALMVEEAVRLHPEGAAGVFAICVTGTPPGRLEDRVHVERVALGQAGRAIRILKNNGAKYCVFAGKVEKGPVISGLRMDLRAAKILARARDFSDDALMAALVKELEGEGFRVLPQTVILKRYVVEDKVYTKRKPTRSEWEDIKLGLEKARGLASLGIGQTVVVWNRAVLAAEALEGTDETIRRGGQLAGGKGGVVVKAVKPGQDLRFDVPTVGLATLRLLISGGLKVLALEAGASFLIDREAVMAAADGAKISVLGIAGR